MKTPEQMLEARRDRFEEWWEAHKHDIHMVDKDALWALCRDAWYTSRRQAFAENA